MGIRLSRQTSCASGTTAFSPGEQLEAGSPVDASFYPIHPTMERLLHYKRMVNDFDNIAWENTVTENGTVYCTQGDSDTSLRNTSTSIFSTTRTAWATTPSI